MKNAKLNRNPSNNTKINLNPEKNTNIQRTISLSKKESQDSKKVSILNPNKQNINVNLTFAKKEIVNLKAVKNETLNNTKIEMQKKPTIPPIPDIQVPKAESPKLTPQQDQPSPQESQKIESPKSIKSEKIETESTKKDDIVKSSPIEEIKPLSTILSSPKNNEADIKSTIEKTNISPSLSPVVEEVHKEKEFENQTSVALIQNSPSPQEHKNVLSSEPFIPPQSEQLDITPGFGPTKIDEPPKPEKSPELPIENDGACPDNAIVLEEAEPELNGLSGEKKVKPNDDEILSQKSLKSIKSAKSEKSVKSKPASEKSDEDSKKSSSKTKSKISEKDQERLQLAYSELEVLVNQMEQNLPDYVKQLLEKTQKVAKKKPIKKRLADLISFFENYNSNKC